MRSVAVEEIMGQLPIGEIEEGLQTFIEPITRRLPDERFRRGATQAILGILGSESPVVAAMAQSVAPRAAPRSAPRAAPRSAPRAAPRSARTVGAVWAQAKRLYRLLASKRYDHDALYEGVYEIGQRIVAEQKPTGPGRPTKLVVAIDPVQFEKPYAKKLEGVSTVHKSTPPGPKGKARLTSGYPAITATVVNTGVPATTYLDWFSYTTADFISQNDQIYRAIQATGQQFPACRIRFVADAGLDDQKIFAWIADQKSEFILRSCHLERLVERDGGLDGPTPGAPPRHRIPLEMVVNEARSRVAFKVGFQHAGKLRLANIQLGWARIRVPVPPLAASSASSSAETLTSSDRLLPLWVLVAREVSDSGDVLGTLVLLTNIPIHSVADAQIIYEDWRLRSRIEHVYRFDQEQGLDVEDLRVQTLERMRRLFALVVTTALFVFWIMETWPEPAVLWFRHLGGKLDRTSDRDGPYLVLRGLAALLQTVVTLDFLDSCPFPRAASPPSTHTLSTFSPRHSTTYG